MKQQNQTKHFLMTLMLLIGSIGIASAQTNEAPILMDDQDASQKKMQTKMSVVPIEKTNNEVEEPLAIPYKEMTPTQKLERLEKQFADGKVHPANYEAAKAKLITLIEEKD